MMLLLRFGAAGMAIMLPPSPIVQDASSSAPCCRLIGPSDLALAPDSKESLATPANVRLIDHLPAALSVPQTAALDERRTAIDCGLCGGARHDEGRTEGLKKVFQE